MNKDKQRYYLQQMDITLWEKKGVYNAKNSDNLRRINAEGNQQADCMIITDAYELFLDKSNQLLNAMVQSIHKKLSDIYVLKIVNADSLDNKDISSEEIGHYSIILEQHINLVSPKIILVLGSQAAKFLVKTSVSQVSESIEELRGKWHHWGEQKIPMLVSYHPDHLLRNPLNKAKALVDLLSLKKF